MTITATAIADTKLKSMPGASADECDYVDQPEGTELELDNYVAVNQLGHHYFELKGGIISKDSGWVCDRWWAFSEHWQITGTEPNNNPTEAVPNSNTEVETPAPEPLPTFHVPGISAALTAQTPIYWDKESDFTKDDGSSYFNWGELLHGGSRIPEDAGVTQNLVRLARELDYIRNFLGDHPIVITSGYRDPKTNRAIGGARWSKHTTGEAADFYVVGQDLVDCFLRLKPTCPTGGLAVGAGFIHRDVDKGAARRWSYAGGPKVSLW